MRCHCEERSDEANPFASCRTQTTLFTPKLQNLVFPPNLFLPFFIFPELARRLPPRHKPLRFNHFRTFHTFLSSWHTNCTLAAARRVTPSRQRTPRSTYN